MIMNRSAPPGPVVPILACKDVAKAIDWLCGAFGLRNASALLPSPTAQSITHSWRWAKAPCF